jgi:MarR family transcriptional regulator for hemolysin
VADEADPIAPTARILDELGGLLRYLARVAGGTANGITITPTQRSALFEIATSSPLRLNDLAGRMGTSAATASRVVDTLDGIGLVERVPDPRDRRALQIDLTQLGRAQVAERRSRVAEAFTRAAITLSDAETASLVDLLSRVRDALTTGTDETAAEHEPATEE